MPRTDSATEELRLEPVSGPAMAPCTVEGGKPTVIGRAQNCAVCLIDPSVSRAHASLVRLGGRWFVTDLGSRHGSLLNGTPLAPDQPALLRTGDLLRLGPYTLRLVFGEESVSGTLTSTDAAMDATVVERVSGSDLDPMVQRRLDLLIEGAGAIHQSDSEEALAASVLDLALEGSGYQRGAVLRHTGSSDQVEIMAFRDPPDDDSSGFTFSRSLIAEAASGHVARVSEDAPVPLGQSIARLAIHSALCAPLVLDEAIVGSIYLDSRAEERGGASDAGGFCHAVSRLASLALANLKRAELSQRQKWLDVDMQAARKAQAFLLPPEEGVVDHLSYALRSHPGRVVAGDLFDIFPLDETRVVVCCGDVSGQGMGAAIVMTAILSHLRSSLTHAGDAAAAVSEVNHYLSHRSPDNMFASLWVGVFDGAAGTLHYVDAGHGHWVIRRRDGELVRSSRPTGLLIGIDPDARYGSVTVDLGTGDRVVVYSDGMVEHRDPAGDQFGNERLLEILGASTTPQGDVEATFAALRDFIGNRGLEDDTTLASIEAG